MDRAMREWKGAEKEVKAMNRIRIKMNNRFNIGMGACDMDTFDLKEMRKLYKLLSIQYKNGRIDIDLAISNI